MSRYSDQLAMTPVVLYFNNCVLSHQEKVYVLTSVNEALG